MRPWPWQAALLRAPPCQLAPGRQRRHVGSPSTKEPPALACPTRATTPATRGCASGSSPQPSPCTLQGSERAPRGKSDGRARGHGLAEAKQGVCGEGGCGVLRCREKAGQNNNNNNSNTKGKQPCREGSGHGLHAALQPEAARAPHRHGAYTRAQTRSPRPAAGEDTASERRRARGERQHIGGDGAGESTGEQRRRFTPLPI